MGAQPGQHILAQRLWLEHDGVGPVAGNVTCQPVSGSDVEFDHLAIAAAQVPSTCGPSGAPQRGGPPVGDPHPGLPAGRRFSDRVGHDPAQVDVVGHRDRAGRTDRRDLSTDPREPEHTGVVAVAVVADQIPAALLGDHAPRLDRARGVGLGPRRPVQELHRLPGIDGRQ